MPFSILRWSKPVRLNFYTGNAAAHRLFSPEMASQKFPDWAGDTPTVLFPNFEGDVELLSHYDPDMHNYLRDSMTSLTSHREARIKRALSQKNKTKVPFSSEGSKR
jgi:hypothetical protein